jgi:drug/metabolite transporter (DMT)-like permease
MSRRHLAMLLGLAAVWGASFLLIEVALEDLDPAVLIFGRIALAALTLAVVAPFDGGGGTRRELRAHWRPFAVLGFVNTALPFLLIAWAQQYVDSGVAAILNASSPLFVVLLALVMAPSERVSGLRLAGFLVGFCGVALVVGGEPSSGARAVVGSLAVLVASALYAFGALYAGRRVAGVRAVTVALGSTAFASLFTLPAAIAQAPGDQLTLDAAAAVVALGVPATGLALLVYYALIAGAGASRAILVTYLVPALAVVYGAVFLDEPLTAGHIGGLAFVLAGVAIGTGAVRPRRRVVARVTS